MKAFIKMISLKFIAGMLITIMLIGIVILAAWLFTGPILLTIFTDKIAFMLLYFVNLPIIGGFASVFNLI